LGLQVFVALSAQLHRALDITSSIICTSYKCNARQVVDISPNAYDPDEMAQRQAKVQTKSRKDPNLQNSPDSKEVGIIAFRQNSERFQKRY
jgi:hypothetical protein